MFPSGAVVAFTKATSQVYYLNINYSFFKILFRVIEHLQLQLDHNSDNLQHTMLGRWVNHLSNHVSDGPSIILICRLKIKQWVAGLDLALKNLYFYKVKK